MNIYDVLQYCSDNLQRSGQCSTCQRQCNNSDCQPCLDEIHWPGNRQVTRSYDCSNQVLYYTGKFIYKYSSEIYHLLNKIDELDNWPKYHITSLGCGPCPELFSFQEYIRANDDSKYLKFIGIDKNNFWENIQKYIFDNFKKNKNCDLKFVRKAASEYFDSVSTKKSIKTNCFIMNYLLSDLSNNSVSINAFFDRLVDSVVSKMKSESIIIVNDINHFNPRDTYSELTRKIDQRYGVKNIYPFHFKKPGHRYFAYGDEHPNRSVIFEFQESEEENFDPWSSCTSSQIAIVKK